MKGFNMQPTSIITNYYRFVIHKLYKKKIKALIFSKFFI